MYGNNSIQDPYFMLLYGLTMMLALGTAVYLLWRRGNAFTSDEAESPVILRRWTAAFFAAAALSHVWWLLLGTVWMTGDKPMRDTTAVALDYLTLIPLMIATLLRMLQDRQRPVWPWIVAEIPVAALALAGIIYHYDAMPWVMTAYQLVVVVVFVAYYIIAVRQYSHWLLAGFADLEHKEVWQSLVIIVAIFVTYSIYSTNAGELYREYMAQVVSILIFIILLWRVETLHDLSMPSPQPLHVADGTGVAHLLRERCEEPELYLRHGFTLADLSAAVGISRGALSEWFIEHGDRNFNGYIHRLRINHFVRLYGEAVRDGHPFTVFSLARQCGYRNYLRFTTAFRHRMDCSLTSWTKRYTFSAIGDHLPD